MATPTAGGFDWQKCIFCQKDIPHIKLNCPANTKRNDVGSGYTRLVNDIESFASYGQLSDDVSTMIHHWDDGSGIEVTLQHNSAKWHHKCRNTLLNPIKLDRLQKRTSGSNLACCDNDLTSTDSLPSNDVDHMTDSEPTAKVSRLTRSVVVGEGKNYNNVCFLCDESGSDLRQVLTFDVDQKVRKCATVLADNILLGKLSTGDMIATEAKYHPSCLLSLYRRAGRVLSPETSDTTKYTMTEHLQVESMALAEVIAYMEDMKLGEITPSVCKLSELTKLYCSHAAKRSDWVNQTDQKVHSTRLKERLLENCPRITAVPHGRDVFIAFKEDIGVALSTASQHSDLDAMHVINTVQLLREEILPTILLLLAV